ncbi:MAG: Leu/Ile/Val-binding protein [Firmicutes bacterium]|nr:Leu/Ile/Val-binding protein [Bacillota bacterium]
MKKVITISVIVMLLLISLSLTGCLTNKPIKIGYVGGLTGRFSDIGLSGHNGVILAIEEANAVGGLGGIPIELIVKDDHSDTKLALVADKELVAEGVSVIIGHMTSTASVAAMPFINSREAKDILMVSPTTRTSKLTGNDDNFFAVMPPMKAATDAQVKYVSKIGIRRMVILYDLANRDFAEDWSANFSTTYRALGGEIIGICQFTSGTSFSYLEIMKKLAELRPEGVLLIAGGIDAAMFCQQIRKIGLQARIFSSSWAMTDDFLQSGGPTVEGVVFCNPMNPEIRYPKYEQFVERYQHRFGKKPDFAAAYGHEAAEVVIAGLRLNSDARQLKQTILTKGVVSGLWGDYTLDSFGDAQRENFIFSVQDGKFKLVHDE